MGFPFEHGALGFVVFEVVEVFEKEQPGRLLGVVELRRAASLFPENVVEIFESLFKYGCGASLVIHE